MMDGPCTAGSSNSSRKAFRTGLAEAGVLHQFQVFRQTHDGSVLEILCIFQAPVDLADGGQHHKVFIIVQDAADGGIDHGFRSNFTDPFLGGFTGSKNPVL